ncbi:hypothetical protein [Thiohalocapsa marina]|uniref:hypothetical protein n=1 Tax=Thiohalocapsa marina TaxID=424902 RepID=UPI0036D8F5F3
MTTITLNLPDSLAQRAGGAARAMHRPLEEVITAMLEGALPSLDDAPDDIQAELVEMTWWDDARLMEAADATMPDDRQRRMAQLSAKDGPSDLEKEALERLRGEYGRVTLRKARALALLSIRSGKRLLAEADAA